MYHMSPDNGKGVTSTCLTSKAEAISCAQWSNMCLYDKVYTSYWCLYCCMLCNCVHNNDNMVFEVCTELSCISVHEFTPCSISMSMDIESGNDPSTSLRDAIVGHLNASAVSIRNHIWLNHSDIPSHLSLWMHRQRNWRIDRLMRTSVSHSW